MLATGIVMCTTVLIADVVALDAATAASSTRGDGVDLRPYRRWTASRSGTGRGAGDSEAVRRLVG